MRISELARRTGVTVHALRHYERLGLLQPARTASGYRDYPESMRREVVFIAMSRRIGFSLQAIADLLPAYRTGRLAIATMTDALQQRAAALERQIAELQAQHQQVIEHVSWLREQERKPKRAPARPASPWPKTAARKDRK
ncbi:MerR family transcriptional regulator [Variovorax saccharolyticus]|uniref:MerR family transcriptional regulator n=1 Tax=Variovorax saccharolyticus TaxID=3053516 RepID=UPI002577A28F|nr:MerR family transcriptional regulator [Variovorax sp. J22R187]MDM0021555.1 MerR family DNA-binding transcriptional regulator [Variovorax sp. J22R187]